MKLIFDTETTGLNSHENQIAQLSYVIIDDDYNIETAKNFYFSVDFVEPGASRVTGLNKEKLDELSNGKVFKDCVKEIYKDFLKVDVLIAHNIDFDLTFIRKEFKEVGYDVDALLKNKKMFCTMCRYTEVLNIPHSYYGIKFPTLSETVEYLNVSYDLIESKMNKVFKLNDIGIGYHDARFDVIATMYVYKLYECVEGIEMNKRISRRVYNIKYISDSLVDLSEYFNNSFFSEEFNKEFYNDDIFEDDSKSVILDIESSLEKLKMNIEKIEDILTKERARIKLKKDLEIKEYVDSKLKNKNEFEIIKAVFVDTQYDCNNFERYISLNEQLLDDKYDQNVDLIELEENIYLMIMKDRAMNFIKINNDSQVCKKENTYEVLEYKECPTIAFDDRKVIVRSYSTILGYSKNNTDDDLDDEIPF